MAPFYLVLTNCTARKRGGREPARLASSLLGDDVQSTARRWSRVLASHHPQVPAHELYAGRSISDAKRVAQQLSAPLYVASAGYGLISADDSVAPYDLTASDASGGLQSALAHHGVSAARWWNALCVAGGVAELLRTHRKAILLAALPASYVAMLADDLMRSSPHALARIRLFTSRSGALELPSDLSAAVMPYDERLESVVGYAGTRADFPQRALKHFVEKLGGHRLDQGAGRQAVERTLARRQAPAAVARVRAEDDQITKLIRQHWRATQGRSSVLLRYLRDEALVACEQGRFARLWREVRDAHMALPTSRSQ